MRNRSITLAAVLPMVIILFAGIANGQDEKDKFKARYESASENNVFDPHDFAGIWMMTRDDHSLGAPAPPLTPAGVAAVAGRVADRAAGGAVRKAQGHTGNPMGVHRLNNDEHPDDVNTTER